MNIIRAVRGFLRNSLPALKINAAIHRLHFNETREKMEERAKLDIFDYKAISSPIDDLYIDYIPENNFYGVSYMIKRIVGGKSKFLHINGFFEHGLFFGKYIAKQSYTYGFDKIFTFGQFRSEVLKGNDLTSKKTIVEIGPYLAYTRSLLSEEQLKEKKNELGKTLLVFPTHSAKGATMSFDNDELVNEIERLRLNFCFKTVMVSLYYRDIEENQELIFNYQQKGYRIVCSGYRSDIHFLDRQRSFIELADVTMSNEVGTHVGYCVYLNKPHYVFSQKLSFKEDLSKVLEQEGMTDEISKSQTEHRLRVESLFNNYTESITNEQREIVEYYWGLSKVKSDDEIKTLFKK